jgi:regulatory protein
VENNTNDFIIQQILPKLEKYCAFQERSIFETKQKLIRLGVDRRYWDTLIAILQTSNFINEERFVELFIRSKINQRSWGPLKITLELKKRGIESALIEQFSYLFNPDNQNEMLTNLLKKKLKTIQSDEIGKQREKLIRFGVSKGYNISMVFSTVKTLLKSTNDDFDSFE